MLGCATSKSCTQITPDFHPRNLRRKHERSETLKHCPTCQASYPDKANFCGADGTRLASEPAAAPASEPAAAQEAQPVVPLAERLKRLDELHQMGLLNDLDYAYHKQKLIAEG